MTLGIMTGCRWEKSDKARLSYAIRRAGALGGEILESLSDYVSFVRSPAKYGPVGESENAVFLFALGDDLTAESARKFAAQTVPHFAKAMSERKKRIIGVLAGKRISPETAQAARDSGMLVLPFPPNRKEHSRAAQTPERA